MENVSLSRLEVTGSMGAPHGSGRPEQGGAAPAPEGPEQASSADSSANEVPRFPVSVDKPAVSSSFEVHW